MKDNSDRTIKNKISDFLYEINRKLFGRKSNRPISNKSIKRDAQIFIIALLAIPIMHWLVFWLYINIQSIALAFMHKTTGQFTFVNFVEIWNEITTGANKEINLSISLFNTLKYFSNSVFIVIPLCLIISFFLFKRIAGYKVFRIAFYLPAIISSLVLITAYSDFIAPKGPLDTVMRLLGFETSDRSPLARPETATTTILIYATLTGFTTNVLLFTGGMSRIPIEVLEASKLDGVGPGREIVNIVFPLIWPTFSTQLIFTMTGIFNATGPILLFTNGQYQTSTIAFWIFNQVYGNGSYGGTGTYNLVSCAGLCFTVIGVPLILFARWLVEKVDTVEY